MEILGKVVESANIIPTWAFIILIVAIIAGLGLVYFGIDECEFINIVLGLIVFIAALIGIFACLDHNKNIKVKEHQYILRVDKETLARDILEKYNIIKYDEKYDVWIVEPKENTAE